jgi:dCMP deaminase
MNLSKRWVRYFFGMAQHIASNSKDPSTQVGCVACGPSKEVRSTGYNGPPIGFPDGREDIYKRPKKYLYFIHAEANAVALACRAGISLENCTIFVTFPPCADCAKLLIAAGIKEVHFLLSEIEVQPIWLEHHKAALDMFNSCGVLAKPYRKEEI